MNAVFCKKVALYSHENAFYIFLGRRAHKTHKSVKDSITILGMMGLLTIDCNGSLGGNNAY